MSVEQKLYWFFQTLKKAAGRIILGLGAGVQSSTIALLAKSFGIDIECAIFADTQAEPLEVYKWLDFVESKVDFPIHRVTAGSLMEDSLVLRRSENTGKVYLKTLVPFFTTDGKGSKGRLRRKCTYDYKITPIEQRLKQIVKVQLKDWSATDPPLVQHVYGISYDEIERMKDANEPWIANNYPLVQAKITRDDCQELLKAAGFPRAPKSACIICPFHSDAMWRGLDPIEFKRAVRWEKNVQTCAKLDEYLKETLYLHSARQPLSSIKFGEHGSEFGNECTGACGV